MAKVVVGRTWSRVASDGGVRGGGGNTAKRFVAIGVEVGCGEVVVVVGSEGWWCATL